MSKLSSKCENCGSDLWFNPKSGFLTCKYCESNYYVPKPKDAVLVRQYSVTFQPKTIGGDLKSYKCKTCGKVYFMTTEGTSSRCPSCGSSSCELINQKGFSADGIIPFKITKKEAAEKLTKYLKEKSDVPKELKELALNQKLMGVYVPVWNFQFNLYSSYSGTVNELKKDFSGNYYSVQNPIFGSKTKRIRSKDECATTSRTREFLDLFDENDYADIIPFSPEYAFGYRIDDADKDIHTYYNQIIEEAQTDFEKKIRRDLRDSGNEIFDLNIKTKARDVFFNFAYVPVYVNTYTYNEKTYTTYISGTTGKVIGKTPVSKWAFMKKLAKFLGLGAIIALLYFWFKSR